MRTVEEIKRRINDRRKDDILGFEWIIYVEALPWKEKQEFLIATAKPENNPQKTEEEIKQEAIDYMPFAWEKANGFRGLSASRSISHYIAWLWLLGASDKYLQALSDDYEFYGKPQLVKICKFLRIKCQWDDNVRLNSEP